MPVDIDISYEGGLSCRATHGPSGAALTTDAPLDNGGRAGSFSPTDLVAAALGTCILTIMGLMAEREGVELKGTRLRVSKEMASHPARRIGSLSIEIEYPKGLKLSDTLRAKLDRAVDTCPVRKSLLEAVKIIRRSKNPIAS